MRCTSSDNCTKANNSVEVIRSQVKEYVDEAGKARLERDAALREIDVLKAKIEQLENLNKLKSLKDSIGEEPHGKKKHAQAVQAEEQAAEAPAEAPAAEAEDETQLTFTASEQ